MNIMLKIARFDRAALSLIAGAIAVGIAAFAPQSWAANDAAKQEAATSKPTKAKPKLDRSGRKQVGEASIYSDKFTDKTMADGNKMDPHDDNAASKTLKTPISVP